MGNKRTKKLRSLGKTFFSLATITIAIASVYVIAKTNEKTNTANLIQIIDAIQQRSDIVFAIEQNIMENDSNPVDRNKSKSLSDNYRNAVTSLLNTYEFACLQYMENKIDKKSFKAYYSEMIKFIRTRYSGFFDDIDGRTPYKSIRDVHMEWHGN